MKARRGAAALALVSALCLALVAGGSAPTTTEAGYVDTAFVRTTALAGEFPRVATGTASARLVDTGAAIVEGELWIWGYFGSASNPGGPAFSSGAPRYEGNVDYNYPKKVPGLTNVVQVASAAYGFYALQEDGQLFTWGNNANQSAGGDGRFHQLATDVVSVSGAEYGGAYIKSDGSVWTVGTNYYGQRGMGRTGPGGENYAIFEGTFGTRFGQTTQITLPDGDTGVTTYSGYEGHYVLGASGKVYYWGRDFRGGAGTATVRPNGWQGNINCLSTVPAYPNCYLHSAQEIPELTALVAQEGLAYLAAGYSWGAMLTEQGNLYTWGTTEGNATGHNLPDRTGISSAVWGPTLLRSDVVQVSTSYLAGQALLEDGTVWAWGDYRWGGCWRLPGQTLTNSINNTPCTVYDPASNGGVGVTSVAGSKDFAYMTLANGEVWGWGQNYGAAAQGGGPYRGEPIWPAAKFARVFG